MPVLLQILNRNNIYTECNKPCCPWAERMSHIVAYVEKDKI